jgi:two-component system, NtrC family, response regulator AtoC
MKIYVVEDDRALCYAFELFLRNMGHEVESMKDGESALKCLDRERPDLLLLNAQLPKVTGLDVVTRINANGWQTAVVIVADEEDILESINALELGEHEFLTRPIDYKQLEGIIKNIDHSVRKTARKRRQKKTGSPCLLRLDDFRFIANQTYTHADIGNVGFFSASTRRILNRIKKIHQYPHIPLLIEGETGTGKEVVARLVHFDGPYRDDPFIAVNCSNLKKDLFEAELFGYEKGAFTGSDPKGRDGTFHAAGRGTLFLDEISEIPLDMQPKLLRVLQEREYYKVGGQRKKAVNCRIVCATNQILSDLVQTGPFREDLFYRLNLCKIRVPPLRDRPDEIAPLFILLVRQINIDLGKHVEAIESDVIDLIESHLWPGNIREMKNILHKVMLFNDDVVIRKAELERFLRETPSVAESPSGNGIDVHNIKLPETDFDLEEYSREIVRAALRRFDGNKTKTAEYLHLSLSQLYRRYKV